MEIKLKVILMKLVKEMEKYYLLIMKDGMVIFMVYLWMEMEIVLIVMERKQDKKVIIWKIHLNKNYYLYFKNFIYFECY